MFIDGGIKIPNVPPAVIVPAASFTLYPDRVIVAPAIMPSSVTEAPTIPVAAAKMVETISTAINREPRTRAMIIWIDANKRSINPAASITMPIKTNKGTAMS